MNQKEIETITINDVEYVKKSDLKQTEPAAQFEGMDYCIVRTYSAGVFAGYVQGRNGKEVTVRRARRIWYWKGAASLSQLAVDGTANPGDCKFPVEVDRVELTEAIEIINCTEKARVSIQGVPVWQKK